MTGIQGRSVRGGDFVYAGLEHLPDAGGLQLAGHRLYDPDSGRFMSADPIGLAGGGTTALLRGEGEL